MVRDKKVERKKIEHHIASILDLMSYYYSVGMPNDALIMVEEYTNMKKLLEEI